MNELYEFMKQVDVIVLFCLLYGLAINGIVWCVVEIICFVVKKVKVLREELKQKKLEQNEDVSE